MKHYEDTNCCVCKKFIKEGTELEEVNVCAVHYYFCVECYKKLYYHFRDVIINKIKHP